MKTWRWLSALVILSASVVPVACSRTPHTEPARTTASIVAPSSSATTVSANPAPQSPSVPPGSNNAPAPQSTVLGVPTADPGMNKCIAATAANLQLAAAQDARSAGAAADQLETLDPPADVRAAIEHFRSTRGAMFNDPGFAARNKLISDWVKRMCPTA